MWTIIHESGGAAWTTMVFAIIGVVAALTLGRKQGRPGSVAAAFAVMVLASGSLGVGTGQRLVDKAVQAEQDPVQKLELLSIGTREAAANMLFSGMCATLLMAVGGALALQTVRKQGGAGQS